MARYLLVASEKRPYFSKPGINYFTRSLNVHPRNTFDFWVAAHYSWCHWNLEIGYDLWWRQKEKNCISCPFENSIGVFDLVGQCGNSATSSSKAKISQSIIGPNMEPQDAKFVIVKQKEFNIATSEHPRATSHTVYGALAYDNKICSVPVLVGIGGSYEFARPKRSALEQWAIWIKTGIGF